ncbi:MAG: AmmeMemoRadiSam system radical SAM enzyme [Bacteroidales bacterium]|jgi:pyruvate formate lyase activating enzyme
MRPLFLKYDKYLECRLCPHLCKIREGKTGICGVRKNSGERIDLLTYGVISGYSLDPVEKKPLYHFFPGHKILSVGSYGCNMRCDFCQNWHISRKTMDKFMANTSTDKILEDALTSYGNIGLAFTYNEPVIWFEYMRDVAVAIKEKGMVTAMISNGFVNSYPLSEIITFIDAFNIDLKAFNPDFYKKFTGADIEPVKETLKTIAVSGKHLEITTLIIPGRNDDQAEMEEEAKWIAGELGDETPLHLSRYYPTYKSKNPPTAQSTLQILSDTARKHLKNVYLGNTSSSTGQQSFCTGCASVITHRTGYSTRLINIDNEGKCTKCGTLAYRYFTFPLTDR